MGFPIIFFVLFSFFGLALSFFFGVLIEAICLRLVRRWPVDIFGDGGGRGSFFFLSSIFFFFGFTFVIYVGGF